MLPVGPLGRRYEVVTSVHLPIPIVSLHTGGVSGRIVAGHATILPLSMSKATIALLRTLYMFTENNVKTRPTNIKLAIQSKEKGRKIRLQTVPIETQCNTAQYGQRNSQSTQLF
jgi:hypothetical protein